MSQRPSASRPTSRSPTDAQIVTLPPVPLRDGIQMRGSPQGAGYERQPEPNLRIATPTQQLKRSTTSFAGSQSSSSSYTDERFPPSSRPLGVQNMLNPSDSGVTSSPRPPSDTQSPNVSVAPSLYMVPPNSGLSQSYNNQMSAESSPSNESFNATFARGRRILTPRSPSRLMSSGQLGRNQGISEQKPSFIEDERARERGAELLNNRPPLHEPPPNPHPSYFPLPLSAQQGNQQSIPGARHVSTQQTPHSQSTSPSTTYSSYSQPSQPSPAALYQNNPPPTSTSYFQPPDFGPSGHAGGQGGGIAQVGTESQYRPSITSGPFQLMTFSSSSGATYQVPVDASSASRLADEKRARNAGASARFRQRRKEKEKEASTQIGRLESQTRKLEDKNSALQEEKQRLEMVLRRVEEERDFYRSERDRYRGLVVGRTGDRELGNGPPSPRSMRSNAAYPASNTLYQSSPVTTEGPGAAERAPRRRRTDTHGEFAGLPPAQGPSRPPNYRSNSEHTISSTLPPLRIDNVPAPGNINPQTAPSSAATTPVQFDPYSQRKWTGGLPPPPQQDRR